MISWGLNYVRVPFTNTIGLTIEEEQNNSTDKLYKMCEYLVNKIEGLQLEFDDYNAHRTESKESIISGILERSGKGYKELSNKYIGFKGDYSHPKRILLNSINNISGFYSPFLFESNVNTGVPLNRRKSRPRRRNSLAVLYCMYKKIPALPKATVMV
jgi:hypothetical protein